MKLVRGIQVTKFIVFILLTVLFWIGCSGRQPEGTWTAEEYFEYAKDMYADEDYFECTNEFTIIVLRYPGSSIVDSAQYYLGMSHYQLDEFIISGFTKRVLPVGRSFEPPAVSIIMSFP